MTISDLARQFRPSLRSAISRRGDCLSANFQGLRHPAIVPRAFRTGIVSLIGPTVTQRSARPAVMQTHDEQSRKHNTHTISCPVFLLPL